ncbi:sensor histidine kinase [Aestuariivirga sp.]|uniref:sensor histidine kinase n=1 Tax=Aestuariivirga sp. TaxID=2650926 RepID=UPI00391C9784
MIAISTVVTVRALTRLEDTQQRSLEQLSSAYLDGLSASLAPAVVREDVWEVFDTLDRSRERYKGLNVQWVTVTNIDNQTIASSSPGTFPPLEEMPSEVVSQFSPQADVSISDDTAEARMKRTLVYQEQTIGHIYAVADISGLVAERANALRELVITNAILTLLLVAFGAVFVRRMLQPVGLLSRHFARAREGNMTAIPAADVKRQSREFQDLFEHYNTMTVAVNEREMLAAKLAEEEKLASVGRLASGMAHEINNPLGGMFNALDSLRRYGAREEVRATSIRLLEHGLSGIRDLVRSTLTSYRADQRPRDLTPTDLDDLRLLVKPEARQKRLRLSWQIEFSQPLHVPAVPIRDAILNLLLNACHACKDGGSVGFRAGVENGNFFAEVSDSGDGIPQHVREYLERQGAGAAPMDRRSGLGLWIVKRHCDELHGSLKVMAAGPEGTTLRLVIPLRSNLENAA